MDNKSNFTYDEILKSIKENGKYETLNNYLEYLNYRSYFKININFEIDNRPYNPTIIYFAFIDDANNLAKCLFNNLQLKEKMNFKKVYRKSNLSVETLKEKLISTLVKEKFDFAFDFANELYLRSKKDFFETLYRFAFLDDLKNLKFLFVYSLEKILASTKYNDKLIYFTLYYIVMKKQEYNYMIKNNISNNVEKNIKLENIINDIFSRYDIKNKETILNLLNRDLQINEYVKEVLEKI